MEKQDELIYKIRQDAQIVVSEEQSRILNNKTTWRVNYDPRWEKILQSMQQSSVKILQIKSDGSLRMFKTISSIKFTQLIQINLSDLNLVSTEPLLSLNSLPLQYIRLNSNRLTNIKSLRKMYYPKLKQLILYDNLIIDCSPLIQLYGDKQKLRIQILGVTKKPQMFNKKKIQHKNPVQNYNVFFKLAKNVQLVANPSPSCLNSKKIVPMFQNKYMK